MPDDLLTTMKEALALIWRDDQCAVPPGWTTEQDGMVCHAFRSVIRDDRGTVLAEARNGTATAIVTVMNNVNALLARCEAAEDEAEELRVLLQSRDVECDAVRTEAARLKAFYDAWQRCDSNRGCYSCCEPHDARCPFDRSKGEKPCACGRAELDAAVAALERCL